MRLQNTVNTLIAQNRFISVIMEAGICGEISTYWLNKPYFRAENVAIGNSSWKIGT